jgi:hypothetical protein
VLSSVLSTFCELSVLSKRDSEGGCPEGGCPLSTASASVLPQLFSDRVDCVVLEHSALNEGGIPTMYAS